MRLVAIDGPSGSGKSAVGMALARMLGFLFFSAGEVYRSLAALLVVTGMTAEEGLGMLENADIKLVGNDEFWVNGNNVTHLLHSPSVEALVAQISPHPKVRARVEQLQFEIAMDPRGVVMEGRNIGTLFPNAPVRFYLDADVEVRACRRHERDGGRQSLAEIKAALLERDQQDMNRTHGRLCHTDGVISVNSSRHLEGPEQTARLMLNIIERRVPQLIQAA